MGQVLAIGDSGELEPLELTAWKAWENNTQKTIGLIILPAPSDSRNFI